MITGANTLLCEQTRNFVHSIENFHKRLVVFHASNPLLPLFIVSICYGEVFLRLIVAGCSDRVVMRNRMSHMLAYPSP